MALLTSEESIVAKLLSKFEDPRFVHVFTTGTADLFTVNLPRFGLEFQVNTSGEVRSVKFKGFVLSHAQQPDDTLLGFSEYLILRSDDETKVLVPKQTQLLQPEHSAAVNSDRAYYVYSIHSRLNIMQSNSIAGRLYLAALYAASGSLLPERRTAMTGDETAMRLLRECWANRPLSAEENCNLHLVAQHTSRNPALLLLCHFVYKSSTQLEFLHDACGVALAASESSVLRSVDAEAASEYMSNEAKRSFRSRLTALEVERILGVRCNLHSDLECCDEQSAERFRHQTYAPCAARVVKRDRVESIMEVELSSLVKMIPPPAATPFPLNTSALSCDKITEATIADLKESYDAHQALPVESIDHLSAHWMHANFSVKCDNVTAERQKLERYLLAQFQSVISPTETVSQQIRMDRLANRVPGTLTCCDLLRIASEPLYLRAVNPFFSTAAVSAIRSDIVLWMKLCVLEDKLQRLVSNSTEGSFNKVRIIQDLLCMREWEGEDHIEWLVFEVEGRLQIRPAQYTVAMAIIQNKGAIVQLNMGEGKTRVILPMLILYWGAHSDDSIVRLHFLTQLLDDGFAHFHEYLCASALNRKIFVLPFNRDVVMTSERAEVMAATLEFCRESRGCVLVAPEHRLSLELKKNELELSRPPEYTAICSGIDSIVGLRYIDMLDESDEVLRHKYQLIYSVGGHGELESGRSRWGMAQNVFDALETDSGVRAILDRPDIVARDSPTKRCHAFNSLRFIPGKPLSDATPELCRAIAVAVFKNHSYEFTWLSFDSVKPFWDAMLQFVTNSAFSVGDLKGTMSASPNLLTDKRLEDLLALRGLLEYQTLFTAMEMRHRVNYGVKRSAGSKRIAVPFKASDTPSERSEFNHPDVAILLTTLSYYYDGLSRAEVMEAFRTLLGLNKSAQTKIYAQWFDLCAERPSLIDCVDKLDLSNDEQVNLLHQCFSHNREMVNFWLNACVLPNETKQYSHKLIANAWNIDRYQQHQQLHGLRGHR